MKQLASYFVAATVGLGAAQALEFSDPVQTNGVDAFFSGVSDTLTCNFGSKALQVVPLENGDKPFIALELDAGKIVASAEVTRQEGVNRCLDLGI